MACFPVNTEWLNHVVKIINKRSCFSSAKILGVRNKIQLNVTDLQDAVELLLCKMKDPQDATKSCPSRIQGPQDISTYFPCKIQDP